MFCKYFEDLFLVVNIKIVNCFFGFFLLRFLVFCIDKSVGCFIGKMY